MKLIVLMLTLVTCSLQVYAQLDSLEIELFVNTPTTGQNFDQARVYGLKMGKRNSFHQFSLGYSNFESFNRWNQFYDDRVNAWTSNATILYNYNDSTPADARRGQVYARSHGITFGWSREPSIKNISFYTGISFTAFINQITIQETNSKAYLFNESNPPLDNKDGEVRIAHTEIKTVSDTKSTSLVPAVNLEAGIVFRLGNDLKLIPKINMGVYQQDNRIYTGTLFGRGNTLNADVRPSMQLSYNLMKN
jgi:hypothetical protein